MAWTPGCFGCAISFPNDPAGLVALQRYLDEVGEPSAIEVLKRGGRLEPCELHRRTKEDA